MPWREASTMSLREEFVLLASQEGANMRQLAARFGVSPKTAYKWLGRYNHEGIEGLQDRSRKPASSPQRTAEEVERLVLAERERHPAWGGRKLRHTLCARYPHLKIPHPNTITDILRRHNCLRGPLTPQHFSHQWTRFERSSPNELWQMDFKGHFPTVAGRRCHPFTVLDDHSRFSVGVRACADEQGTTVQGQLTYIFRTYGLPARITMDNGSPWGDTLGSPYTPLTVWLLRLGVGVSHSIPYHPQTQGKDERFHRTLKAELLHNRVFMDLRDCQARFDEWRSEYNLHRPHQALDMQVPASRYRVSEHSYPEEPVPIEYPPVGTGGVAAVRKVQDKGKFQYKGRVWQVSKAFRGYPLALVLTHTDGVLDVYFCQHSISQIDLCLPDQH